MQDREGAHLKKLTSHVLTHKNEGVVHLETKVIGDSRYFLCRSAIFHFVRSIEDAAVAGDPI